MPNARIAPPFPCRPLLILIAMLAVVCGRSPAVAGEPVQKFARENLVAWCIVPFDANKRAPEERAAMLDKLGLKRFAYDWRAEHIPTFDAELEALKKHGIKLQAFWFPAALNDEAQQILAALARHDVQTELWITMGDPAPSGGQADKVAAAVRILEPLAAAAEKQACKVGLYNHGGWFGEPDNQLAIIAAMTHKNVGLVYNLHHGHEHLEHFAELLQRMQPHLLALNLNGMDLHGDAHGRKILQLGQGELDLQLLKMIASSKYDGPIGILGHTQDDAEARLADNLAGLDWLVAQLQGQDAGPRPTPRTPVPPKPPVNHEGAHAPGHSRVPVGAVAPGESPAYDAQLVAELVTAAKERGRVERGMETFRHAKFACLACHKVGEQGGAVGPPLTEIGRTLKPEQIVEAVLWPQRNVKPEFMAWRAIAADGKSYQGYKQAEDAMTVTLKDATSGEAHRLTKSGLEELVEIGTLMPDGLTAAMSSTQQRDLVAFLLALGHTPGLADQLHMHSHAPAPFVYDKAPLDPTAWPLSSEYVNRDRLYDFYTKEANYFRQQASRPMLLPAFPGLDGGQLSHWGNQDEEFWRDARWNDADLGTVLSGVFRAEQVLVPKGVCVRLGEHGELATCFNPETLTYDALWRGGFLKFSPVRHGFMDSVRPAGELLPRPEGKQPEQPFTYHGFYRVGPRVVFAYQLGDVEMLDAPWVEDGKFTRVVAPREQHPLKAALTNGPAQWPQEFIAKTELGSGKPYAVDTIYPPFDNPWKAPLFFGGHAFLADGTALVCTMQGDVWRVSGLDDKLANVRWRRFASGLHQALGMVVHEDAVYVVGRDQITRLHDHNHDGEADFYECCCNKMLTSVGGHDYTCGLVRDERGRFYTSSGKQGLIRISADGEQVEVLANGFRNGDGLGIYPDGAITVPCSEGEWTPATMICLVEPSASPASPLPHYGHGGPQNGQRPRNPFVYLPRGLDNSAGGQVVIPDDRWGPLAGRMVHLSFGQGCHFLLLRDDVGGEAQGAITPLVGDFRSGAHRGKFSPRDGQLYISGMSGWGSYTPDDGCFQRVRYTGDAVQLPSAFHIHENGVLVKFTSPIDRPRVETSTQHFAQAWNYRYSPGYGSPELSPSHPGVAGHDYLEIAGVHALDDHTLFVELPDLQPVNQLHLMLEVDAGRPQELFLTVNKLDKPYTQLPGYRPFAKLIAAHPLDVDLASLRAAEPNPWREPIPKATKLSIVTGPNLTYTTRTLKARAGEPIRLTFSNPDVVPHNWVLVKPGTLAQVGGLANKLIADPAAVTRQYVPASDDVLVYTDIVAPEHELVIYFHTPREKGRYPFLCTFPGHWMVMNGELIVE
jgi:putative heme-binding domain-containing protein